MPVWPEGISPPAFDSQASPGKVAGIDEAGRGPWAGPVVASAVILPSASLAVRIDDSKRLTPKQRETAFEAILERSSVGFGVVSAAVIDSRNILQATFLAMQLALEDLAETPSVVLVDGNAVPKIPYPCIAVVNGDGRSLAIAAASIMAKVMRDRLMRFYHGLEPRYAFDVHKGYGTPLHLERLTLWGPSLYHRKSFRPVAEAGQKIYAETPDQAAASKNRTPVAWAVQ